MCDHRGDSRDEHRVAAAHVPPRHFHRRAQGQRLKFKTLKSIFLQGPAMW